MLESFIQTEVKMALCAAVTNFKRPSPQGLLLGVILLSDWIFFYSTWKFKQTRHSSAPVLLSHVCMLNQSVKQWNLQTVLGEASFIIPFQNPRKFSRSLAQLKHHEGNQFDLLFIKGCLKHGAYFRHLAHISVFLCGLWSFRYLKITGVGELYWEPVHGPGWGGALNFYF